MTLCPSAINKSCTSRRAGGRGQLLTSSPSTHTANGPSSRADIEGEQLSASTRFAGGVSPTSPAPTTPSMTTLSSPHQRLCEASTSTGTNLGACKGGSGIPSSSASALVTPGVSRRRCQPDESSCAPTRPHSRAVRLPAERCPATCPTPCAVADHPDSTGLLLRRVPTRCRLPRGLFVQQA